MVRIEKKALGRGLNALFGDEEPNEVMTRPAGPTETSSDALSGGRKVIGIAQIVPGKYQPRHTFNNQSIEELAQSISQHGLIQPLLVRPLANGTYEIIAGERRWRAAQKAMLHEVPVIIREIDDATSMEIGLIENLQREDLNPIDEANALARLINEFKYTQEEAAQKVGKSRSYIANILRLHDLNPKVADIVRHGQLSAGHARALLPLDHAQQFNLAHKVVEKGLSVRQLEKMVADIKKGASPQKMQQLGSRVAAGAGGKDVNTLALEKEISNLLGMGVSVDMTSSQAGKLTVEFKSLDQLDDVIRKLSGSR